MTAIEIDTELLNKMLEGLKDVKSQDPELQSVTIRIDFIENPDPIKVGYVKINITEKQS